MGGERKEKVKTRNQNEVSKTGAGFELKKIDEAEGEGGREGLERGDVYLGGENSVLGVGWGGGVGVGWDYQFRPDVRGDTREKKSRPKKK